MSDTASIARSVISESESASTPTPSAPDTSNAAEFPELAVQEMDALAADDKDNLTRRIAAAATVFHDRRNFVSTKEGLTRRQFDDDGNATRRFAREAIDTAAWAEGRKADPRDKAALAAHRFAKDINRSTMDSTLPEDSNADAVIDQVMKVGRANR